MKKALITVSFGTSYQETLKKTIEAVEKKMSESFPNYEHRRAFTSGMVIKSLAKKGLTVDNTNEALKKLETEGFEEIILQPTHIIEGFEYEKMLDSAKLYSDRLKIRCGYPLLHSDSDYENVSRIVVESLREYENANKNTAFVLMGHGSDHKANASYLKISSLLKKSKSNFFMATVEGEPELSDILEDLKEYKDIVLQPFMIVAGDHATNDMAGDDEDSWKSILTKKGHNVTCVLKGLGEIPEIQEIFVTHAKNAQ